MPSSQAKTQFFGRGGEPMGAGGVADGAARLAVFRFPRRYPAAGILREPI